MYMYYGIVKDHGIGAYNKFRLVIKLPLKSSDKYCEAYQINTLFFFDRNFTFKKIYQIHHYLAIAEGRPIIIIIIMTFWSVLQWSTPFDVTADSPVYSRWHVTCLLSAFLENVNGVQQSCRKVILPDFTLLLIRFPCKTPCWNQFKEQICS